jgi:predicted amidohydrolase
MERNLERIEALLADVDAVDVIALPEVFAFRGNEAEYRRIAEGVDGVVIRRASEWAAERSSWVLAGSFCERAGDRVYNTCVLLDRSGGTAATYRKMHLFEAFLEDGTHVRESDAFDRGEAPVTATIEGWRVGLGICYDLRFPEVFRNAPDEAADLFFVPSNFTQRTGEDHWEVLLRSRAIENQCFVVAPGQCGANPATGVVSYGNSMAVGPWGEVLCRAGDTESVMVVDLDPESLTRIRSRIPVLSHRRL